FTGAQTPATSTLSLHDALPILELGDLRTVEKLKETNIPLLADLARAGYAVLTPVPSCTLMFKQELPLIFPGDPDVQSVADAMFRSEEHTSELQSRSDLVCRLLL